MAFTRVASIAARIVFSRPVKTYRAMSLLRVAPPVARANKPSPFRFMSSGPDADTVRARVIDMASRHPKVSAAMKPESSLSLTAPWAELGLDSLDSVELIMAFEEEFVINIPDQQADSFRNLQQVIDYFIAHPMTNAQPDH